MTTETTESTARTAAIPADFLSILAHLHRGGAFGNWWTWPGKIASWWPAGRPSPVPSGRHNVYFGVHPVGSIPTTDDSGKPRAPAYVRSRIEFIAAVNCLFGEMDAKDFGGDKAATLAHVDGLAVRPSVVIDSGGGYHCYWLLADTFVLATEDDRRRAAELQAGWVALVGGDPGAKDLARVLRVPGTRNYKPDYAPDFPTVTILRYDAGALYPLAELAALIPSGNGQRPAAAPATPRAATPPTPELIARAKAALARLSAKRRDAYHKDAWYGVGMALCELGEIGFELWHDWSKDGPTYKSRADCEGHWRTFIPGKVGGKTLASLFAWADEDDPRPGHDLNELHMTDAGQGEAIAAVYGDRLRFDHAQEQWYTWDGVRWHKDDDRKRENMALDVARQRLAAAARCDDDKRRNALAKWALQSENRQRLESALYLARTKEPISTTHDQLDRAPWLLTCANGVLDLRSGELRPGAQADMLTLSTGVAYAVGERCDRWLSFLQEVFNGDDDLIAFIQRAIGYTLTGLTDEQCLFLCYGNGANGKSVFLSTLRRVLGEYAVNTAFSTFIEDRHDGRGPAPDLVALRAARCVTASEVNEARRLDEGRIKSLTGGDVITARQIFVPKPMTFTPAFKLWLAANHKPVIRGTDEAIWRRVRLIPFLAHFGPGQADPRLTDKLAAEAPGILGWAVSGCLAWQRDGLGEPEAVKTATDSYRAESDVLATFLDERTATDATATVRAGTLYAAYKGWCESNGEKPMTGTAFGRRLTERGFDKMKDRGGWEYIGLSLASEV